MLAAEAGIQDYCKGVLHTPFWIAACAAMTETPSTSGRQIQNPRRGAEGCSVVVLKNSLVLNWLINNSGRRPANDDVVVCAFDDRA